MSKPKVLYLSTSLNIGGTENFLLQLAKNLKDDFAIEVGYIKDKGTLGRMLEQEGFRVIRFGSLISLWRYLKLQQVELLHTFLYRANIYGRLCGHPAGVPAVIGTQQAVDKWKNTALSIIDRVTAPFCDCIVTNSHAAKESLHRREKIPLEKMPVIYNGIDGGKFRSTAGRYDVRAELAIPAAAKVAISVTRLHYDKGADYLPSIISGTPDVFWVIVGDGPERTMIETELRRLGIEERCRLLGWRNDVGRLLSAADVFVLPSREESFPQAVLEAMAASLPVVVADVGGVREIVTEGKTGLIVPPGNIAAFADAVKKTAASAAGTAMGIAGRARSMDFTQERMVKEMKELYVRLLEECHR